MSKIGNANKKIRNGRGRGEKNRSRKGTENGKQKKGLKGYKEGREEEEKKLIHLYSHFLLTTCRLKLDMTVFG